MKTRPEDDKQDSASRGSTMTGVEIVPDDEVMQRLRRVEGQIKGIQRMLEGGRSCEEVITQVMAARAALDRVATNIITTHVQECISKLPPERAQATIARAIELMARIPPSNPIP